MTELLTAAQMRAIEAAAIASGEVTGLELMERAGRGVVEGVFAEWPDLRTGSFRAVVLCGPGNNGGDGFVVARLLKDWGWEVEVFLYGDPKRLPPDARTNYERWVGMGGVRALRSDIALTLHRSETRLIVDAVFGIGGTRPPPIDVAEVFATLPKFNRSGHRISYVAVDIPTGLCSDSGNFLDEDPTSPAVFQADLTVSFHRAKPAHYLSRGPGLCGKLAIVDIGLPGAGPVDTTGKLRRAAHGTQALQVVTPQITHTSTPWSNPVPVFDSLGKWGGHKFSYGHALILSGPPGYGGAARMTARGALRIGAGLVTLVCPPEALAENAGRLDAIMLKTVVDASGLEAILADSRINALCLGPGLGISEQTRSLVAAALKSGRAMVLDADALTLIARDRALFAALHQACVLTPHGGEFARLFPDIAEKLEAPATKGPAYSKVDATREAAARAGCVVLFKGPDTVIASPDGTCAINSAAYDRAALWLATAGSGDVLAGFITGLLARGFCPQEAAETGAWLHVECARSFGPGLIAEDLPEELPKVFRALGL